MMCGETKKRLTVVETKEITIKVNADETMQKYIMSGEIQFFKNG